MFGASLCFTRFRSFSPYAVSSQPPANRKTAPRFASAEFAVGDEERFYSDSELAASSYLIGGRSIDGILSGDQMVHFKLGQRNTLSIAGPSVAIKPTS
jgi:hypothetical protein